MPTKYTRIIISMTAMTLFGPLTVNIAASADVSVTEATFSCKSDLGEKISISLDSKKARIDYPFENGKVIMHCPFNAVLQMPLYPIVVDLPGPDTRARLDGKALAIFQGIGWDGCSSGKVLMFNNLALKIVVLEVDTLKSQAYLCSEN